MADVSMHVGLVCIKYGGSVRLILKRLKYSQRLS